MELIKNKITKFEQIRNSNIWKAVYIGLAVIISIGYFIFSYFYIQEARYIEVGGTEFEVKEGVIIKIILQFSFFYLFLIYPILSNLQEVANKKKQCFLLACFLLIMTLPILILK